MSESKQKIALFIDADNAPASKFEAVLSEVAKSIHETMATKI
ncbi:hypothetical protein [Marinobacter sediminicola]|nr:hypothetical protein [Marinobacter sp. F26243]